VSERVRISAGELSYVDEGEGPALVLLHGFPLSSHAWRHFVPMLSARFRVIAPDLLGCGDSDKPAEAPVHIRAQAGYVRELVAALGIERYAVVGASHGGGVAQLLALDRPGVEAMVLLNPVAFDYWPSDTVRAVQENAELGEENESFAAAIMRSMFDLAMGRRALLSEMDLEEYLRPWRGPEGVAAFFRCIRAIDGLGLAGRDEDFAALELPVMILWGEDDGFLPVTAAERLHDAIPTSTLGLLPGCGHFVTEDAADTIAPMVYEYLRARYLKVPHGHDDAGGIVRIQLERKPEWVEADE
jgi:pimeloyl-ACP methyl ester carboxylesterase